MKLSNTLLMSILVALTVAISACSGSSSVKNDVFGGAGGSGGSSGDGGGVSPAMQQKIAEETAKCRESGYGVKYIVSTSTNGNACTTGCMQFSSLYQYCHALRNDSLNNNCGANRREQMYQRDCT